MAQATDARRRPREHARRRPATSRIPGTTPTPASATRSSRSGCSCRRRRCSSARSSRRTSCTAAATRSSCKGPTPDELFNIPFTSVTSFILLMSSLTMVLALAAIQRGDHRRLPHLAARDRALRADVHRRPGLRVHRVLPRGPALSHEHVRHDVLRAHRPARRARHDRHHLAADRCGAGRCRAGSAPSSSEAVEIAGLYWHFVDIVWIFIFTAIYLIPQH